MLRNKLNSLLNKFKKTRNENKLAKLKHKKYLALSNEEIINQKYDLKSKEATSYIEYRHVRGNRKYEDEIKGDQVLFEEKINTKIEKLKYDRVRFERILNRELKLAGENPEKQDRAKLKFERKSRLIDQQIADLEKSLKEEQDFVIDQEKQTKAKEILAKRSLEKDDKISIKLEHLEKRRSQALLKNKTKLDSLLPKLDGKIAEIQKEIAQRNELTSLPLEISLSEDRIASLKDFDCSGNVKLADKIAKKLFKEEVHLDNLKDQLSLIESEDIHLQISRLSMHFGGIKAVDDVSFKVKRGEIFGLIGPNGAGKTTIFNCITQFYKPTYGHSFLKSRAGDVFVLNDYKTHKIISLGIARTFQNVELILELTVLENLLIGAHSLFKTNLLDASVHSTRLAHEEKAIRNKALAILTRLGIVQYKDVYPIGLPYGILKKIELARVLMSDPELIILDEPAAGLNEAETKELAKLIREIRDKYQVTVFLVEHDMGLVMDVCDQILAISFGKEIGYGTPLEIKENPEVKKAYLGGD